MTRLGGRKFIGFIVLALLGLVLTLKGASVDANVVALLIGAYGIFAGSNMMAGKWGSSVAEPRPTAGPSYGDEQVAEFLNRSLMPQLNQLVQQHQATAGGLNQLAEQVMQLKQNPSADFKSQAEQYRKMLAGQ